MLTVLRTLLFLVLALPGLQAQAGSLSDRVSISLQNTSIHDVMRMLSLQQRLNIFVADGVEADVSINMYDMRVRDALYAITQAAGLAVEERNGNFFVVERDEVGKHAESGVTETRAYKVQYSEPSDVEGILKEHISSFGNISVLQDRRMLVVKDQPVFLEKVESILETIDREPRQVLIQARIMEVTLTDDESFGLDWRKIFSSGGGSGSFGTRALSSGGSGLFLEFAGPNLELALNALRDRGRLRTLSTPRLLAMEDREAQTVVGSRTGYRVTTTINQVTSESIEFLESGIILKVTPSVDRNGQILLDIEPEVSTATVSPDGIPSKSTTQLETRMLVPDGQTVFLGGLISRNLDETRTGVPVLGDLPGVGGLFSNRSSQTTAREIVVLITPKLVDFRDNNWNTDPVRATELIETELNAAEQKANTEIRRLFDRKATESSAAASASGQASPGQAASAAVQTERHPYEDFQEMFDY